MKVKKKTNGYLLYKKHNRIVEAIADKIFLSDEAVSDLEIKRIGLDQAKIIIETIEQSSTQSEKLKKRWNKIAQRIKDIYEII